MMIVAGRPGLAGVTGTGDVLEPEAGVRGIGSGGNYRLASARALPTGRSMPRRSCAARSTIAADICVYTNRNVTIESLKSDAVPVLNPSP